MKGLFSRWDLGNTFISSVWMNCHMCLHIYIRKFRKLIYLRSLSHHINKNNVCQYKPHYFLSEITTRNIDSLVLSWICQKFRSTICPASNNKELKTWFKLFMLRTICIQEPNSGIDKLLFSAITFDLIEIRSGIWSKILNKTCFLEDANSGTHMK